MLTEFLDAHDLRSLLVTKEKRIPFPRSANGAAWAGLSADVRQQIQRRAEEAAARPYPMLSATMFLAFVRAGDRKAYEVPYFDRRRKLMAAALGYCVGREQDLDAVIDGLWCICEESFWGISAHNGSDHPGQRPAWERPLPEVGNPYIDLFAAQTAALLCWVCYLLRQELDAVSPLLARRAKREAERRVLAPFFHHDDFWWMGMIRGDVNNWTPWILSNIMAVLILLEEDDLRLCEGLARAMRMLDRYLAVLPEDGGCDEGAAYWNVAGGALLDCLECLYTVTGGRCSFYQESLIRRIGEFPLHAHIDGPYFWNFADCDAKPALDGERVYRYGKRIGHAELTRLGVWLERDRDEAFASDMPEMSRVLNRLFSDVREQPVQAPSAQDVTLPFLQAGARTRGRLYAAFKGGHNAENHNHNDVGSFILYADGKPAIIDLGNMTYTAKTFSAERYTLPNTRGAYHNVPIVGAWEQAPGRAHCARQVVWEDAGVSMDIAAAYPAEAGVVALRRGMSLGRDETLSVADEIRLQSAQPVSWVFLFREKPACREGCAQSAGICLRFDKDLAPSLEEYPVTDERMAASFPGSVWRLRLTAASAAIHIREFLFSAEGRVVPSSNVENE